MSRLAFATASLSMLSFVAAAMGQTGNPFEQGAAAPQNPFEQPKPAAAAAAMPSRVVMRMHTFNDPKSGNMPSHTILVPEGWQVEGGAFWADPQRFFKWMPSQNIRLTAPDGRMIYIEPSIMATHFVPSAEVAHLNVPLPQEGTASGGMLVMAMPQSAEQWRNMVGRALQNQYPNATDLRVDPVELAPELDAQVQKTVAPMREMQRQADQQNPMMQQQGFRIDSGGNGLSALAHYTLDGKPYDQLIVWATFYIRSTNQVGVEHKWWIEPCVNYRAPGGRLTLELPMMMAVAQSLKMTPQWADMKGQFAQRMHQLSMEAIRQNGEIMAESQRNFARQQNAAHAARMAAIDAKGQQIAARGKQLGEMYNTTNVNSANDKGVDSFVKAMREVTDYKASDDSGAPSVQLPSHYDHVYGNSRGEFILTNDGNFNPNLDPTFNAGGRRWGDMAPTNP